MFAPKVSNIDIARAEFRTWAAGMKASAQLDGGALSLKTKFVNFMKLGSQGKEDYKEIEERLLVWAKMRCKPV